MYMRFKRLSKPLFAVMLFLALLASGTAYIGRSLYTSFPPADKSLDLSKLRFSFEQNVGQTDSSVQYLAHASGANLFFAQDSVTLSINTTDRATGNTRMSVLAAPEPAAVRAVTLRFLDAQPASIDHGALAPGKVNYLVGSSPSDWHTGVSLYSDITYKSLYPGVDLTYSGEEGRLKGTYTVAPGADPAQIAWRYGDTTPRVDDSGNLVISEQGDDSLQVLEVAPVAWQEVDGQRISVEARYAVQPDGSVKFALGAYNKALPLVIDPTLAYSTYLGGSSSDNGYGIAVDAAHNIYVAGGTGSSDYPLQNALQPALAGNGDLFITKLNAAGTALVYSTYLGGTSYEFARAMAVDSQGDVVVVGQTSSTDFPLMNAKQPGSAGGNEAFVTELNAQGSALLFSTYLGGSGNDTANGVAVDPTGNVYVTGSTTSAANFPTFNAIQSTYGGGPSDAFVTKYSPNGQAFVYSTYLGGTQQFAGDVGFGIAADSAGNAYITGDTTSANFPTFNAFEGTYRGGESDAFVTKLNPTGSSFIYSTYLGGGQVTGGSGADTGYGVATDGAGNAYITGDTDSYDFPIVNPLHATLTGFYDVFITKMNATGSALVYSTYMGGNGAGNERGMGIAANASGEAAVVGIVDNNTFPIVNAIQPIYGGQLDAFAVKLAPLGSTADFVTYLGGGGSDYGQAVAIDDAGSVYATGLTASNNFPLANPFQAHNNAPFDVFISKIADPSDGTVTPTSTATSTPSTTRTATSTSTSTPTQTPTHTPILTSTATAAQPSQTSTSTATPTIGPPCGVLPQRPALTSCQTPPDVYSYSFTFYVESGCQQSITGPATLSFRVANNPLGPFTLFDQQIRTVTFPAGPTLVNFSGTLTETAIPADNFFYMIDFGASNLRAGASMSTGVSNLCQASTPVPTTSATVTSTPATATPTATTTTTTATSTSTSIIPPSVTPTACALQFTDVDPNNTFYASIRCLSCMGIVNGYTTGCDTGAPCFKPGNNVTRGQTAKIVSNSAGFNEVAGAQQFEDVLPGSTFYDYVWRLANRGFVSGYPCGGAGEPCGADNLPYFRPNAAITRGQITKIDSEAAGYSEPATGQQFEDVPIGSTFYTYIYRLVLHDVMSGYPCGGVGEPCGSGHLPYFRPGNNATRGQTTKIVANTFFPDCAASDRLLR